MNTVRIDDHTFDLDLLNGKWVIDAGARGFAFSKYIRTQTECSVYSLDIEDFSKEVENNFYTDIFKHAALSHQRGKTEAYYFGNGTANFLKGLNDPPSNTPDRPCEIKEVEMITLEDIYDEIGTNIDLLKLDIEGAEYEVLLNMRPIPKQVTVEFHAHCHNGTHYKFIDQVLDKMRKDYHMHLFNVDPRYPYLDCLFIRKDVA